MTAVLTNVNVSSGVRPIQSDKSETLGVKLALIEFEMRIAAMRAFDGYSSSLVNIIAFQSALKLVFRVFENAHRHPVRN